MLHGIKVLDLTRVLAGPLCTMLLGDLGAEVIKLERPDGGDETRRWGPPFDASGQSAYFLSVNRNKLSVAADLDRADDRELLLSLMRDADVVVDNFRRGTLERRGLDPEELLGSHPRLIWCTITGFGPGSDRPGYDYVAQAECGWMAITGAPDGEPTKVGVALADVVAGKDAAIAILAALLGRERSHTDRRLFVSLAASARAALVNVAQNALVTGEEARRWGNAHPNLVPYELFPTADRPLVIAVGTDAQWRSCARALELPELADDEALASNAGRVAQRGRIVTAIGQRLRDASAAFWQARLAAAGVPAAVVRGVLDVVREAGGMEATGMPSSVSGTIRYPPPKLDEHGALIRQTGWSVFNRI
ncbi:MAG TPA: CoA transferase [Gemmatimonadaceae bacterium]|nr:CoA transferase [Gemmatimonadaceae bacterium]